MRNIIGKLRKVKRDIVWKLGYDPLVKKPDVDILTEIKESIRTRDSRKLEAEIENIMFEVGLYNKSGEYAMHLNTSKKADNHFVTMWRIPRGLTFRQYREKEEVFSDNLTARVTVEKRNGNLMIDIVKGTLPEKVIFKFKIKEHPNLLLPIMLGQDQLGPVVIDLQKLPHLLITGTTGTGKSISLQNIVLSLAQNGNVLVYGIDLGRVNMSFIKDKTVFAGTLTDASKIIHYLVKVMNNTLDILDKANCVDVETYNKKHTETPLPYRVLLIDEFSFTSDKMTRIKEDKEFRRELYTHIASMSFLARKTGIHLVVGLQKAQDSLIPTEVRDMFAGRLAHRADSVGSSMTALGNSGAFYLSKIPGRAILKIGNDSKEIQCAYFDPEKAQTAINKTPLRKDDKYGEHTAKRLLPR